MTSIFENTTSKITVHILHDDTLTDENRKKFIRTAEKYHQGLNLLNISEHVKKISDKLLKASKKWTIGATYRLFIPEVMPEVKKVIYFDCDVLVNMDIAELWAVNDGSKTLYGALDCPGNTINTSFYREKMRILLNGLRPETYINSGVLVMNLDRIRERGNLSSLAASWIAARGGVAFAPDQDALNVLFHDEIQLIDSKFNTNVMTQDISGRIVHMILGKPWETLRGIHQDRLYWKMFLRSAWGENATRDDVIDLLNDVALSQPVSASYSYSVKHVIEGFYKMVKLRIVPTRAIKYIILHAYYRLKDKITRH